jgi:hypothetical protein
VGDVSDLVDALLAKRFACNEWPDGASKTAALGAIDDVIAEIREEGAASKWVAD